MAVEKRLGSVLCSIGAVLCILPPAALSASPPKGKTLQPAKILSAERVVDPESRASFLPPSGWRRTTEAVAPNIIYVSPTEPSGSINIGMVSAPSGKATLAEVIRSNKEFTTRAPGMTIYGEHDAKLAGQPAYTWRMHLKPASGRPHEIRQIFCVHDGRSYVLTLTALPSNLRRYEAVFDRVVASFAWPNTKRSKL